ncbi:MAG: winged helix-turn-helix domain-containing protein [Burkholderiaceae bacterium]|nr:winged helix-turn-helix domain-containing protein [Burkholderiaceae bacterium]
MRPLPAPLPDRFTLGPWRVSVSRDEVAGRGPHAGKLHKLEPRAMRLLVVLAQAGGEVVMADALLNAVWPGLVVTPSSLYDAVAQLRKVLGPDHIATVPRKGYRLATPVMPDLPEVAEAADVPPAAPARHARRTPPGSAFGGRAAVRDSRPAGVVVLPER